MAGAEKYRLRTSDQLSNGSSDGDVRLGDVDTEEEMAHPRDFQRIGKWKDDEFTSRLRYKSSTETSTGNEEENDYVARYGNPNSESPKVH